VLHYHVCCSQNCTPGSTGSHAFLLTITWKRDTPHALRTQAPLDKNAIPYLNTYTVVQLYTLVQEPLDKNANAISLLNTCTVCTVEHLYSLYSWTLVQLNTCTVVQFVQLNTCTVVQLYSLYSSANKQNNIIANCKEMNRQQYAKIFIDLIGPSWSWPNQVRLLFFGYLHLNNVQRFIVTVFLLANGINPELIRSFFQDCFRMDSAAHRQIEWIIHKYPESNWKQWNVSMGSSV
jgi:hypothetical protein